MVIEQHLAVRPRAEFLSEHPDNPYSPRVEPVECAILDSETIETEWGFVFFYQSKQYVETGDFSAALAGDAPLVVLKETGDIYAMGTAEPVDDYLKELEGWLGVGSTPRRRPDVEVELTMTPTAEGGRKGPAFSGYRPHFAIREDFLTSGQIELVGIEQLGPGETAKANITFLSVLPHSIWQGRVLRAQEEKSSSAVTCCCRTSSRSVGESCSIHRMSVKSTPSALCVCTGFCPCSLDTESLR